MSDTVRKKITLLEFCPEVIQHEWYGPYNAILGLDPDKTGKDSGAQAYWKCPACGYIYRMTPRKKMELKSRNKTSCFACRGRVQIHAFTI